MIKHLSAIGIILFSLTVAWMWGRDIGIDEGVDFYHHMCYNNGPGQVVDEHGHTVTCAPLTKIPEEEMDRFFHREES